MLIENIINNNLLSAVNQIKDLFSIQNIIYIKTVQGALKPILLAALLHQNSIRILIITESNQIADEYYHNFFSLIGNDKTFIIKPSKKSLSLESEQDDNSFNFLDEVLSFNRTEESVLIVEKTIFERKLPELEKVNSSKMTLKKGETYSLWELSTKFILNGFERVDFVASGGQISIRGGILDLFPLNWDHPIRIEFFGDEIESIRSFNTINQRSIVEYDQVELISDIFNRGTTNDYTSSILDYLPNDTIIVNELDIRNEEYKYISDSLNRFNSITFNSLGHCDIKLSSISELNFNKSIKILCSRLIELLEQSFYIHICADRNDNLQRIRDLIINSSELEYSETIIEQISNKISWHPESLTGGFISDSLKIAVFNEHEIFGRHRNQTGKNLKRKTGGITLKELKQLEIGDYIVHDDKGIGRFDGLEIVSFNGRKQDCVRIVFADNDMLYVHLNYLNKIHKYSSEEGVTPKLSKLGSNDWNRKKAKTKSKLKDIARNLIRLYAERKSRQGYAYPVDSIWQKEFEASFIYEDTPDQSSATQAVKSDMESLVPMDRLVCGDVGFGKTEIAIRAAFKAAQMGKQVAVLVPTTILAQQHYMSFKDRLNPYPVHVASISRIKSSGEQKKIIENLNSGKIDILIGTHRLLSKDIQFKDLGLLIIDEEHRFGVAAKEKLKEFKSNVDTLTLTATPIPRTLNFSLMGARDLSIMETAPRNRLPIITEIMEWSDEEIAKAIKFEVSRGGQVFFVNDRIGELDIHEYNLKKLIPDLRIGIVHGQMSVRELERNMEKFINGKFDVLISTKIIESGLDIPNANTIIINNANNFGLAELYQLRGRVGRSNTQAYCYLIISSIKKLTNQALRRLQALEEFTELGSGIKLALKDLEIRGAGNLLGPEQSGFINDMGFELYQKILDEAVKELKIQEFPDIFKNESLENDFLNNDDIQIDINKDAYLSQTYINNDKERYDYYKRLYSLKLITELDDMVLEIKDRYGKMPEEVKNLIFAVKLRIIGLNTGIKKIQLKNDELSIELPDNNNTDFYSKVFPELIDNIESFSNAYFKEINKKLILTMKAKSPDRALELIWRIKKIIESVTETNN